uniref:Uncharacterized protein n=1 Tax=Meloidogyne incognita TaxID=6306 RepID=A0A914KFW2_MELIC
MQASKHLTQMVRRKIKFGEYKIWRIRTCSFQWMKLKLLTGDMVALNATSKIGFELVMISRQIVFSLLFGLSNVV